MVACIAQRSSDLWGTPLMRNVYPQDEWEGLRQQLPAEAKEWFGSDSLFHKFCMVFDIDPDMLVHILETFRPSALQLQRWGHNLEV